MNKSKILNIRGALLDKSQLSQYIEKAAAEHSIKTNSNRETYPIPVLRENYKFILETYNLLNRHLKMGIKIHSAGDWILDNFYVIEETVKSIEKELNLKKYKKMNGLSNGPYKGFARAYVLAEEIVAFSDCKIDREIIDLCLNSYQRKKLLSMEEICNIGVFFKISIISHVKELCEKIYSSQIQKYRVESIIERIIEKKQGNSLRFVSKTNMKKIIENQPKYPFIEYMSYKLKKYGKKTIPYQEILEKEVQKLGLTISDVVQKEHFYIANTKITLGNCITSIRTVNRINFSELFSYMNASEEILKLDPYGIYPLMDQESKNYYRGVIEELSKKSKISEIYISEKIIKLCKRYENYKNIEERKKSHVGYYLIKKGIEELKKELEIKTKKYMDIKTKSKLYIASNILIPLYLDFAFSFFAFLTNKEIFLFLLSLVILYVPVSEIYLRVVNYVLGKIKKPTMIPKMNYENGIPESAKTFVVIPTIVKSKEKVKEMMRKLEVYYLANKSENLYFALLGDCSEEQEKTKEFDEEVIITGLELAHKLSQKYKTDDFSKFHFLYRKREWNECENSYIGWERKRGLLLTFNYYIKRKMDNNFLANTIELEKNKLPNIKYIITLDSDTNLNLEAASKLIGGMSHLLNIPEIKDDKIVDGYGIMQPRIGMDLSLSHKTDFIQLFSMQGGIDCYTNAISDIYQDYFEEGIFTGKGIYDVDIYNYILKNEIPENTVLSHDLLEGNFLRCGLLTDVMLLDGYPSKYISYISRNHRWTRGDWQIVKWLKSSRLNKISKFKIYDNLRRSLLNITSFSGLVLGIITCFFNKKISNIIIGISIVSLIITYLLDIINYIIFKESNIQGAVYAYKKFSKDLNNVSLSLIRIVLQIAFWPYEMYKNLDSIIRSLYRMKYKKKLLEWVTAEDSEKNSKTDLLSHYKQMQINIYLGIIIFVFRGLFFKLLGILWIIAPIIAWYISLEKIEEKSLKEKDRKYLEEIGRKTWEFFEDYLTEENNYLMIDNYQEDRNKKIVNRTSSTNIGLELLAIISAYDLGFIKYKKCIEYIRKVIETIDKLSKWNGHLYNWYNTNTLEPLIPRYVSTVDSGNFVGYLFVLKQFLISNKHKQDIDNLILAVEDLIQKADFSELYSPNDKLLSIGFNLEENRLTDSYYDFLASEARQASLISIAKGDVPVKHWNNLSRTLTSLKNYKGLISWTGTAFEYLMPNVNIKRYRGSLLDESSKFAIMSQMEYCRRLKIPWGISESAFNLRDLNNNYQYRAFGIPWLGLKRGLEEDIVISPYSTFLSLEDEPVKGIENLRKIEEEGGIGKYGFYEAIDYTSSRLKGKQKKEVIKTFMAHHQGLILLSINNFLNNNIIKKRFNENPEIEAVDILLQERMPVQMILTKENKEKIAKNKMSADSGYIERVIKKPCKLFKNINVLSNEKYRVIFDDLGNSVSEYENKIINSYKSTSELKQGVFCYIKNTKTKKVIETKSNSEVIFAPDKVKFIKRENNLKIEDICVLDPNKPIEIRRLEIENLGNSEEVLEIISSFEPVLSLKEQEYAHPAFNKLFLSFEKQNDNIIVERKDRNLKEKFYLATTLYTENEQIVDFEYEIDKEKYLGRENYEIPQMISKHKIFSNTITQVVNPIVAMKRTIKLLPKEKATINVIISVSEDKKDALDNLENIKSEEEIIRTLNIARARSEEESKYLQVSSENLELYSRLLKYILRLNHIKKIKPNSKFSKHSFWKYGISGDLPILLVKIKNIEDIYVVEEVVNAFDYFRSKTLKIDLVILNDESNVYERFVKENINEVISNKQLDFLKNVNAGIFILNKNELLKEDLDALEFKSSIIINASFGGINLHLKELEEKEEKYVRNVLKKETKKKTQEILPFKEEELLYENGYGGFTEDGKEYHIYKNKENKLPTVWSNILSNKFFGTIVTDNLGGYTWDRNCRLNRLTAWNNDCVLDFPSEIFYIKDEDTKDFWTLNTSIMPNENYYYISHGFGYSKYKNTNHNLFQELNVFVPNEDSLKIMNFKIKNLVNEERKIKFVFYFKTVLGEDEIYTNGNLEVEKSGNILFVNNVFEDESLENKKMYIASSENINSFTGEKDNFWGEGDLKEPDSLYKNLNNKSGLGKDSCVGFEFTINLHKFEEKNLCIIVGEENSKDKIIDVVNHYLEEGRVEKSFDDTKQKWENILSTIQIKTPIKSLDIMMNGWLVYQTVSSRLLARTGYYQSGGAFGFRDQLQDALGIKYVDSIFLEEQIKNCARHQFLEGDVLHWWHVESKRGIRTRFSDDMLWLVYGTIEYVKFKNDYSILDEKIAYLKGNKLQEDEEEKYDIYYESDIKESLFEHCIRAIENTLNKGIEPFPKIGIGDWNDGMNKIGHKGKGQSVWLSFFLYNILKEFIPICEMKNRGDLAEKYREINDKIRKNVNTKGWDGRWFKRAITDEGEEIGSMSSEECRIDSISQSWSVISDAGDNDKKFIAMEEAENYLVDKENKIIKLFDPPFEKSKINPGYIKAYPSGIRENGGQYTHASIWLMIAQAILGFGNKAVEYMNIINPIEHSKGKDEAKKFKLEPYVLEADLYNNKDLMGRGGWNWYTGSSSWYFKGIIEYILGLKIQNGYLEIVPCIDNTWKEYEIRYKYKTSIYNIKVKNPNGKNTGVEKFLLNGEEIKEKKVILLDNGKIYQIEIFL